MQGMQKYARKIRATEVTLLHYQALIIAKV